MKIALLGTGLMGFPMALNLLKSGFELTVWNRSADKAQPLEQFGAKVAKSPKGAVADRDVIISMLSNGDACGEVIDAVQHDVKAGAVWIDMSSIKPKEAKEQSAILSERGVSYLDAPVSGGTKGAEAGSLAIMVGGEAAVFDQVRDVFAPLGRPVLVGPTGAGQLAKLANQAIVGVTIGAVAEAMLFLEKGGADPAAVRNALRGGFADSTILQQHGERMTNRDFEPGGLSTTQLKDLDNVLDEAASLGLSLPMSQDVRDRYFHLIEEMGQGATDHSGLYLELVKRNEDAKIKRR